MFKRNKYLNRKTELCLPGVTVFFVCPDLSEVRSLFILVVMLDVFMVVMFMDF